ncbi:hypothetical protein Dgeo_2954 (plasmid) [Deinococcus geothermalis DSM 11300]|uniref:Uncharacterized protein n=1 Tax=Deinococcus geothermalis (strain DSM 11300 / CIP 105573 / AG-3a) TaxID=319795 RepID=A8ZR88_DEIGD|nr:hypothetical protein Dgeo_2954 [Deinococcus geothermalis DSM 11300]
MLPGLQEGRLALGFLLLKVAGFQVALEHLQVRHACLPVAQEGRGVERQPPAQVNREAGVGLGNVRHTVQVAAQGVERRHGRAAAHAGDALHPVPVNGERRVLREAGEVLLLVVRRLASVGCVAHRPQAGGERSPTDADGLGILGRGNTPEDCANPHARHVGREFVGNERVAGVPAVPPPVHPRHVVVLQLHAVIPPAVHAPAGQLPGLLAAGVAGLQFYLPRVGFHPRRPSQGLPCRNREVSGKLQRAVHEPQVVGRAQRSDVVVQAHHHGPVDGVLVGFPVRHEVGRNVPGILVRDVGHAVFPFPSRRITQLDKWQRSVRAGRIPTSFLNEAEQRFRPCRAGRHQRHCGHQAQHPLRNLFHLETSTCKSPSTSAQTA